jgi:hypothetical protein
VQMVISSDFVQWKFSLAGLGHVTVPNKAEALLLYSSMF